MTAGCILKLRFRKQAVYEDPPCLNFIQLGKVRNLVVDLTTIKRRGDIIYPLSLIEF